MLENQTEQKEIISTKCMQFDQISERKSFFSDKHFHESPYVILMSYCIHYPIIEHDRFAGPTFQS